MEERRTDAEVVFLPKSTFEYKNAMNQITESKEITVSQVKKTNKQKKRNPQVSTYIWLKKKHALNFDEESLRVC